MDPLSISASILTVLAAAQATRKCVGRHGAIRQAPAILQGLNNEVTEIEVFLNYIRDALGKLEGEETDAGVRQVSSAVEQAADVMADLKTVVEETLTRTEPETGKVVVRRRGFFKTQRLQELHAKLKDVRRKLETALGILNHLTVQSGVAHIRLMVERVSIVSPASHGDTVVLNTESMENSSITQAISQAASSSQTGSTVTTSYLSVTATSNTGRCAPFCACQCHCRNSFETPRWLQGIFGALFIQYSGTPILNRRPCNLPQCTPYGGRARFEYRFPTFVMPTMVAVSANWDNKGSFGGGWSLRAPDYIPESLSFRFSDLVRHERPVQDVEQFLDHHGISGRAITVAGRSLLHICVDQAQMDISNMLLYRGADIHHRPPHLEPTMTRLLDFMIMYPQDYSIKTIYETYLDQPDVLETSKMNVAHRIVAGLLSLDLETHLDLYPHSIYDRDVWGDTPLIRSVKCENLEAMTLLLERGSDVNARNAKGETAMHYAAQCPSEEFCQILIGFGADIEALDMDQDTPLMWASMHGSISAAITLLEAGANPNYHHSSPAIFYAANYGYPEVGDILCAFGAEIDLKDLDGYTPTMGAIWYNQSRSLKYLVDKGARLDILDKNRWSVVNFAARYGSVAIMKILANARIRGIPMDEDDIDSYWRGFDERDEWYVGERAPIQEEEAAFQELLDSILPAVETDQESSSGEETDEEEEEFVDAQE